MARTLRSISEWREKLLQHVVEEADAGLDVVDARAVEIDGDARISVSRVLRSTVAVRMDGFVSASARRIVNGWFHSNLSALEQEAREVAPMTAIGPI